MAKQILKTKLGRGKEIVAAGTTQSNGGSAWQRHTAEMMLAAAKIESDGLSKNP